MRERDSERNLRLCFSEDFFDEFMYDSEFRALFLSMENDTMNPYQAIEHLARTKKQLMSLYHSHLENSRSKIKISTPNPQQNERD